MKPLLTLISCQLRCKGHKWKGFLRRNFRLVLLACHKHVARFDKNCAVDKKSGEDEMRCEPEKSANRCHIYTDTFFLPKAATFNFFLDLRAKK